MNLKFTCIKEDSGVQICLHNSVHQINENDWNTCNFKNNIYLSIPYLSAIENSMSHEVEFRYIQFYSKENTAIGSAIVQVLKVEEQFENHEDIFCKVKTVVKQKLLNTINAKVLVCGNLFSCGENGFAFIPEIDRTAAISLLNNAFKYIKDNESVNDNQVSYYLMKEFWPDTAEESKRHFEKHNFRELEIDANMLMPIHSNWSSFEDYLESMTTKFRTKAKSTFKKSAALQVVDFSANDIRENSKKIEKLFANVVNQSEFNLCDLTADAFAQLKENLARNFVFRAYKLNDKIVGFSTATVLYSVALEANYVGLDYTINKEYAVYQRMLYDMIDMAIEKNLETIYFGRTAEELKSTLGAQPAKMKLYIRHRNTLSNQILKPVIASIKPTEFELRNPFKAAFTFA